MTEAMRANNLEGTHFILSDDPDPEGPDPIPLFPEDHPAHRRVMAATDTTRRPTGGYYIDFEDLEARDAEEEELRQQHELPGDAYRTEY